MILFLKIGAGVCLVAAALFFAAFVMFGADLQLGFSVAALAGGTIILGQVAIIERLDGSNASAKP